MKASAAMRWLSILVTVFCLALLAYLGYFYRDFIYLIAASFTPVTYILIIATIALQMACRTARDLALYSTLGFHLRFRDIYELQARQNLLNYMPFKAGTIYAAAELQLKHGVNWTQYTAAFAAQNVITLAVTMLLAATALAIGSSREQFLLATAFALIGSCSLLCLRIKAPSLHRHFPRVDRALKAIQTGVDTLVLQKRRLFAATLFSALAILLSAWRFQMLASSDEMPVNYGVGVAIAATVYVSFFISVTPGGLGIREALVASTTNVVGLPAALGLIASTADRLFVFAYCGVIVAASAALQPSRNR